MTTTTNKEEVSKLFKELAKARTNQMNEDAKTIEIAIDTIKTRIHQKTNGKYFPFHKPSGKITNPIQEKLIDEVVLAVN